MTDFAASRARRARALRAAQVVTLSASLSGVSLAACGGGTDTPDAFRAADAFAPSDDAFVAIDAFVPEGPDACACGADGGPTPDAPSAEDAPVVAQDAPVGDDAFVFAGDGGCGTTFPPINQACCELTPGGFWDEPSMMCFVAVPGPFVPPSMVG